MYIILIFLFGSAIGSFLNVLIDRIPRSENLINSRSKCEKCLHILKWYDLIPLFSYIFLMGKCRYCKAHIPIRILLVEIITGFLFVLSFLYFKIFFSAPFPLSFILTIISVCSLIVIFFMDLEYGIISDEMLVVLAAVGMLNSLVFNPSEFFPHLITGAVSFLFFFLIFIVTRGRGMGFGDVKFAFVIGFLLGFPRTLFALYAAFLTGAFISLILIMLRKKRLKGSTISFGPFLVIGIFIAVIFEPRIREIIRMIY